TFRGCDLRCCDGCAVHRDLHSFPTRRSSDLGADDYVVKPFSLPELAARVAAGVRRRASQWERPVELGSLRIDPAAREVTLRGERSEEHTSELQSRENLVCRLLLEKKKEHHLL